MNSRLIWFTNGKILFCSTFDEKKQEIIYNFSKGIIHFFDAGFALAYC